MTVRLPAVPHTPIFDHAGWAAVLLALLLIMPLTAPRAAPADLLDAVVGVNATVPADARTADSLGTRREGTGVLIDSSGLVLTIGYLILEADQVELEGAGGSAVPAEIVAYDHETGFGLVRALGRIDAAPVELGGPESLRPRQPLLAVSRVGELEAAGVFVTDRRTFAGYWEYLLEDAIFTAPPHRQFGGAALFDDTGRLIGIGSLVVGDAAGEGQGLPGNMFVPVDQLQPILSDLLAEGRRDDPPRPWLGAYFEEHRGRVFVTRVTPDGPAERAGLAADDLVVGVAGKPVTGLVHFYQSLWGLGEAGIEVELDVLKGIAVEPQRIQSGDRYQWLRLQPSL